jgi:hypothetical protein
VVTSRDDPARVLGRGPWCRSAADQEIADATARSIRGLCPSIDGARCTVIAHDLSLAVAHSMRREIFLSGGVQRLITPEDPETVVSQYY